ncbi:DUF732 domain-containing protein [Nocardia otitidiscaviarum]|uniref:DUF732 domain-containing protein n=1 Tax=Nocardia otitidiscaviarum TaxID=1823 RepID=UPI0018961F81|nr:DUF732 domain-containing protein [Nocardia otitidiscaviarum]MBF6178870.1 DUF732 domain-containing protein [Nocardia otitidiscaviarum]
MQRTRGKVIGVVAACAAAGLLAACGDNDSTATSTPTLSSTTQASSAAPSTTESAAPESPQSTESTAPPAEENTERPQPVPTEFVTPQSDAPALSDKDRTYIEELKKRGVTPSSPDIALSAGNLVCQGKSEGAPEDQIITYVTAIAGSDPTFDPSKMPVEEAGKIYYEVASASYCR